ncbi:MAG: hypothetical protein AAFZ17_06415 [Cyanobacteria bacterium J06650_10]
MNNSTTSNQSTETSAICFSWIQYSAICFSWIEGSTSHQKAQRPTVSLELEDFTALLA